MKGFGLSPGITRQQRLEIEGAAKSAFENLDECLKGTYYPLQGMDEKVRQQMVDDHFLFMSGDKNLKVLLSNLFFYSSTFLCFEFSVQLKLSLKIYHT